jgi:hypothetical protein
MEQNIMSIYVLLIMLLLTCVPPAGLLVLLLRRYPWLRPAQRRAFRRAITGSAIALAVNLIILTVSRPDPTGSVDGLLGTEHLLALGLSWACLMGIIAVVMLYPRRRRIVA